jgi:hypothetical protein
MTKALKIIGGVVVTLVAVGMIANFHDIKRYARISMM